MKKIFLSAILSVLTIFAMATTLHIDNVRVNTENSTIKWIGSKICLLYTSPSPRD